MDETNLRDFDAYGKGGLDLGRSMIILCVKDRCVRERTYGKQEGDYLKRGDMGDGQVGRRKALSNFARDRCFTT